MLDVEVTEGVAVLTMNRADRRNALSSALVEALLSAFEAVSRDTAVRAVILAANGPVFCAGADLAEGLAAASEPFAAHEARARFGALLEAIAAARPPVIAAVHGDALGGGFGLAAACDLVVADERARFGTPEIAVGLFPFMILAVLRRDLPRKVLMELALTGEPMSAERAAHWGLVNRVVPPGEALATARGLAAAIARRSPAIVALGKSAFHRSAEMSTADALDYLRAQLSLTLLTEDAAEGLAAFVARREPQWKGK